MPTPAGIFAGSEVVPTTTKLQPPWRFPSPSRAPRRRTPPWLTMPALQSGSTKVILSLPNAMTPPSSIAHYKITTKLGEGGMGAVYRATDTKLARDVAIKVLPDSVVHDADRLARFTREAQVLASLNHPNIAAIYGVEDRALILELVEGPTLAERLAQGPIPIDEALPIARQIADAMEFAHERGIIHRDLKPANIKIRDDGTVKVLDFGLAKALSPDSVSGSSDAMNSPTLTARATQIGVILGTAAYMAPEQAKGKIVDRRADIWAFGVVVFEMLTGKRGYQADDVSDTLAAVLTREVDWTALPADTPPRLRTLLRDCLARDPKLRLRDIGEARRVLDQLISGAPDSNAAASSANVAVPARSPVWQRALPWTIAVLAVVAAIALFLRHAGSNVSNVPELRLQMVMPGDTNSFAISPDGRSFAFSANAANGSGVQLWLRSLDSEVAKPLAGTEQSFIPFWSPDSKSIGFFAHQSMKRIDVESGAVRTLADAPTPRGGSWNRDGTILFSPAGNGPLYRILAAGGKPEQVTQQRAQDASHRSPQFLPDGHHFLFYMHGPPECEASTWARSTAKNFTESAWPMGPRYSCLPITFSWCASAFCMPSASIRQRWSLTESRSQLPQGFRPVGPALCASRLRTQGLSYIVSMKLPGGKSRGWTAPAGRLGRWASLWQTRRWQISRLTAAPSRSRSGGARAGPTTLC